MPFTNETEEKQVERAVLVGLSCPGFNADQAADERTMDELRALAETAGAEAVAMTLQRRPAPDARTFIGEGKAEEVKALAEANDASLILFDNELSPSQMSNLEELTGRTVLDRSEIGVRQRTFFYRRGAQCAPMSRAIRSAGYHTATQTVYSAQARHICAAQLVYALLWTATTSLI